MPNQRSRQKENKNGSLNSQLSTLNFHVAKIQHSEMTLEVWVGLSWFCRFIHELTSVQYNFYHTRITQNFYIYRKYHPFSDCKYTTSENRTCGFLGGVEKKLFITLYNSLTTNHIKIQKNCTYFLKMPPNSHFSPIFDTISHQKT